VTDTDKFYEEQYSEWLESTELGTAMDTEELRVKIGEFLEKAQSQDVREYTLERKYNQLNTIYGSKEITNMFGEVSRVVEKDIKWELTVKNNIWTPETHEDYLELQPELLLANNNALYNKIYNCLRLFISTGENNNNIGRNLYYIVRDKVTGKYLGNLNLSSDYLDVRGRDQWVGWTREQRNQGRINHTTVASTLVPTQPLGYNYVGGKLLSLLAISSTVQQDWEKLYGDKLAGVTTTSLYGSFSQYSGLKYWKSMGKSAGATTARPEPEMLTAVRQWLRVNHTRRYWEWYYAKRPDGQNYKRDHINRSLQFAYRELGFKTGDFTTNHARGIYFCPLYTNTAEFLRDDIGVEALEQRFDNSIEAMVELWKTKYASKRIKSLLKQQRTLDDVLFYDDLLFMSWNEAKERYLPQVGR
jgi:hypothetical protein